MYARMIQLTAKSGEGTELIRVMKERALPLLKQQPGFLDAIALRSEDQPDQFTGLSVWKSREDFDRYFNGPAQALIQSMRSLLVSEPVTRGYNVEATTIQNLSRTAASD